MLGVRLGVDVCCSLLKEEEMGGGRRRYYNCVEDLVGNLIINFFFLSNLVQNGDVNELTKICCSNGS